MLGLARGRRSSPPCPRGTATAPRPVTVAAHLDVVLAEQHQRRATAPPVAGGDGLPGRRVLLAGWSPDHGASRAGRPGRATDQAALASPLRPCAPFALTTDDLAAESVRVAAIRPPSPSVISVPSRGSRHGRERAAPAVAACRAGYLRRDVSSRRPRTSSSPTACACSCCSASPPPPSWGSSVGATWIRPQVRWPWYAISVAGSLFLVGAVLRNALADPAGHLTSPIPDGFTLPGYAVLGAALIGLLRSRQAGQGPGHPDRRPGRRRSGHHRHGGVPHRADPRPARRQPAAARRSPPSIRRSTCSCC